MMLRTERMNLRRFSASDVDNLLMLDGDAEVMRFLDSTPRTRADIETTILPAFLANNEKYGDLGYWSAHTHADDAFVGWFGLRPVAPTDAAIVHWRDAPGDHSVAELGYRLRRSAWGSGLGTDWPDPLEGTEHGEVEYRVSRDYWLSTTRPDAAR